MHSRILRLFAFDPPTTNCLLHKGLVAFVLAFPFFGLTSEARAVTPAPDGGYSNQNTAEGTNALNSLSSGSNNTANGFEALFSNTTGGFNTATGFAALFHNTTAINNTADGSNALESNTTGIDNTAVGFRCAPSQHKRRRQYRHWF
jgi:hypothetical protein